MRRHSYARPRSVVHLLAIDVVAAVLIVALGAYFVPALTSMRAAPKPAVFTPAPASIGQPAPVDQHEATEDPGADEPASTVMVDPVASWKVGLLLYSSIDVRFRDASGKRTRLATTMSDELHALTLDVVKRIAPSVRQWSGGLAAVDVTVIEPDHPLTQLARFEGGYWAGPDSVAADLAELATAGRFDSVIVVWPATDYAGTTVPQRAWGLTLPPGPWAGGAGFSSISAPTTLTWWTDSRQPEEVFVHEWLHQALYFHADAGLPSSDLDRGDAYGYEATADGSWLAWLSDVMTGRVVRDGHAAGLSERIWAAGTPTAP